jgi:hypothetical protein
MDLVWTVGLDGSELGTSERGAILKALVTYEDAVVGNRVLAMLNSVARGVETSGRLLCSLWRFHFLGDHSLLEMAAAEAAGADIIIIALPGEAQLPFEVSEWISLWLPFRHERPKALVAFADEETAGARPTPGAFAKLREVARLGRMDFFPAGDGAPGGAALQRALTQALAQRDQEANCVPRARHSRASRAA